MSEGCDVGDDAGPCPRCKGPTKVLNYDEAPWGFRGNYSYECSTCGEFGMRFKSGDDPTPDEYIFRNDGQAPVGDELKRLGSQYLPAPVDMLIGHIAGDVAQGRAAGKIASFTDRPITCFKPYTLVNLRYRQTRGVRLDTVILDESAFITEHIMNLPDDAMLVAEPAMVTFGKTIVYDTVEVVHPKRCQRCGRLEVTCDSGLYGDCVDQRR